MEPRALTRSQQEHVDALAVAGRIKPVPADVARAEAFLAVASERIGQLSLLTSDDVKFGVAYDAAHDAGEALLAAHGYRTANGAGQHQSLGEFLKAVIDGPPGDMAAARFDRLRRVRNRSHYEAVPVAAAEALAAERVARELCDAVRNRLAD